MSYNNEQKLVYQREWCRKRRQSWVKLLGGKCVDCGKHNKLEFDHVDRKLKKFSIGKMLSWSEARVLKELKKCVLRCRKCHEKKSVRMGDLPPKAVHGQYAYYKHHGCRCRKCKRANSDYMAQYRAKYGRKY